MQEYKIIWHTSKQSTIKSVPLQKHSSQSIVIKAKYSLVSHGSERLVINGLMDKETAKNMRVPHMDGDFHQAFSYGYSLVGEIIDGPSEIIKKSVHLLHPHAQYAIVDQNESYFISENFDLKYATLASNMETALNAVWDAEINASDKVLVIGYGLIGALIASVTQHLHGVTVYIIDTDSKKNELANQHGYEIDSGNGYDKIFHTSATQEGLQLAIDQTNSEGKIIELSWYGNRPVTINLGSSFHYGRKQIISSQVSKIPTHKAARWNFKSRKDFVFKLLAELKLNHLIDHEIDFVDSPSFFNELRNNKINNLSTIINY